MREIKFRGKPFNGKWRYGNYAHIKKDFSTVKAGHYISNSVGAPFAFLVRPETVSQFTGLKDRNGVDIYEGDIIQFYEINYLFGVNNNIISKYIDVVTFEGGCFTVKNNPYDTIFPLSEIGINITLEEVKQTCGCDDDNIDCYGNKITHDVLGLLKLGNIYENPELLNQKEVNND